MNLENEPTLLMTGGTWDPHSESFQGQVAEQVLRSPNFDQLFIGADGIDLERGTTTFNELTGLKQSHGRSVPRSDRYGGFRQNRQADPNRVAVAKVSVLVTDDPVSTRAR